MSFLLSIIIAAVVARPVDPDQFAKDAATLAADGWRLADAGTHTDEDGLIELTLVLRRDGSDQALALTLELADWGDRPVAYRREAVPAPAERRVYPAEAELFALLGRGPVLRVSDECGVPVIATDAGDYFLDDDAWYVVVDRWQGKAARAALARELGAALESGAALVDVRGVWGEPAEADGVRSFELMLAGGDLAVLHVELDAAGRPAVVELRSSPLGYAHAQYSRGAALAKALKKGKTVEKVVIDTGKSGEPVIRFQLGGKHKAAIDTAAFEPVDDGDHGCGC